MNTHHVGLSHKSEAFLRSFFGLGNELNCLDVEAMSLISLLVLEAMWRKG